LLRGENSVESAKTISPSSETSPTATRYLYLVRHGQYVTDAKTASGKVLTDLGRRQAAITGQRLKQLGIGFSRFVQSGLIRAQQTAEIIANELEPAGLPPIDCDSQLNEGFPCRPTPYYLKVAQYKVFMEGARIESAFRKHFHRAKPKQLEDSHEIIVCHANVIRYFVCRALQVPPEAWLRLSLAHGSITQVAIYPNGFVSLRSLGDAGHIPGETISFC